jgi:cell division septation protein DedD
MKSKYLLGFLVVCILFSLNACKSKESAYKAAYKAATVRELPVEPEIITPVEEIAEEEVEAPAPVAPTPPADIPPVEPAPVAVAPVPAPPATSAIIRKESVTVVGGTSSIQQYNVVIGSFINRTNALSLTERMISNGYPAVLVQNEKGMYRVIAATFDNKAAAAAKRDDIKQKYLPEFQDAWILDKN